MSQTDPYSPPKASLGGPTPAEQHDRDNGVLRYSTFWQRVGATLIDSLILTPLFLVDYFLAAQSRMYELYAFIPSALITAYFYLYLVVRHGGTPGKLLMGLRIANLDGSRVGWKAALLRLSILWLLELAESSMSIVAALGMTDEAYLALGFFERSAAFEVAMPLLEAVTWLMIIWFAACLVTMLANSKRRTLHDFIAGTVVVRK